MKKIVLSVLLVLVFICPIFALDLDIRQYDIVENGDSYFFSLAVATPDLGQILIFMQQEEGYFGVWCSYGDSIIIDKNYLLLPVSYNTSEENIIGDAVHDNPILLYDPSDDQSLKGRYYNMLDFHQVDFLTALLNDGYVVFELADLSVQDFNTKRYYFNISNNEDRLKALELYNRYMNYFY